MIIAAYCQPVSVFRAEVQNKTWISKLRSGYIKHFGGNPSPNEASSWSTSHPEIEKILTDPSFDDCQIMLEAQTSITKKRIDVLLLGKNANNEMQLVVIELKAWSVVKSSSVPDHVQTILGGGYRDTLHPAIQAEEYSNLIQHSEPACDPTNKAFQIATTSFAYLHNMPGPPTSDSLFHQEFTLVNNNIPSFLAGEGQNLAITLQGIIGNGGGSSVLPFISNSGQYISRNLATIAAKNMPGTPLFNLIGRQVTINRQIQAHLNNLSASQQKQVVIIRGGPGSGKTAVGIQSILAAISNGQSQVAFCARNAGFVAPLRLMLRRTGLSPFIKYPFVFSSPFQTKSGNPCGSQNNSFDYVVVDEAHRLPIKITKYNSWTIPHTKLSGLTTAEEIIRCSRVSVFIIDENQVVNPQVVNMNTILNAATNQNANVTTFDLEYQFRCGGSSNYVKWVESMMYPNTNNPNFKLSNPSEPMKFNIVDDPNTFQKMIQTSTNNDVRIITGWCWKWNSPSRNKLPLDIVIRNHNSTPYPSVASFEAPWENKKQADTWAIRPNAIHEVGCIYTIQGLDFDRICLIWPLDLQWNLKKSIWTGFPSRTQHKATTKNPPNEFDNWDPDLKHLDALAITPFLQNVYNVLLTRANAEIFVYFMDAATRSYFEKWL